MGKKFLKRLYFLSIIIAYAPYAVIAQEEVEEVKVQMQPAVQSAMKQLMADPTIKKALAYIQAQNAQTLKDHILLTEIPAPPFAEQERARQFVQMLQTIGVDSVWTDEVGNVIALRKGKNGKRTVALDAHLDTVFPEGTDVKVRISGDTLFAPGVGDDTRGLAILLAVLKTLNDNKIGTDANILFIGSVGEEGLGDLRGVKHLFSDKGPKIDSWISIDGGDLGRVNYKGLGSYRYRVVFRGPGGHSWGAFGLANPHHALGACIQFFVEAADRYTKDGPKTSYNIGRVGGGTSVNSIPFSSWMEIDVRSLVPDRLDVMDTILRAAVKKAVDHQNQLRRAGRPLTAEVEIIGKRPSGELSPDILLIQRAMAILGEYGIQPIHTRGSTNSNIPISMGIPSITIGRGGKAEWAHSLLEWWADEQGYKGTQYAMLLLLAEAGRGW